MLACIIAVILNISLRRSPWIVALWLPSFLLTGGYTFLLASQFLQGIGQGSNAGWFFFAGMLQTFVGLPIVISAVLLLVWRPKNETWRPRYLLPAIIPIVITPIALLYWFNTSTPLLSFIVTDEDGRPFAGVQVRDTFNSEPKLVADQTGVVCLRLPQRLLLACVFTADGYQEHHVVVEQTDSHGESFCIDHSWYERGSGKITNTTNERVFYSSKPPVTIPIAMKKIGTNT
jgi:hypothetical protein